MREIHIGEMIKQRRMELGLTQWDLSEGICEPGTLSRIESGKQTPSRSRLNALLQRLGLPGEKFYAMMSENELEVERLKDEIVASNIRNEKKTVLALLERLEKITEDDDVLTKQFLIRSRLLCGRELNGLVVPYEVEDELEQLLTAIKMTVPKFKIDNISSLFYSFDEVKIINKIALCYSQIGEMEMALSIYQQLMEYVLKHGRLLRDSVVMSPLISYNYSRLLCMNTQAKKAVEIAQIGIDDCIRYGKTEQLPGLLFMLADSYRQLGNCEEAKERFLESYYIYRAMNDFKNAEIVQNHILETMNMKIPQ